VWRAGSTGGEGLQRVSGVLGPTPKSSVPYQVWPLAPVCQIKRTVIVKVRKLILINVVGAGHGKGEGMNFSPSSPSRHLLKWRRKNWGWGREICIIIELFQSQVCSSNQR
jgi:hypothetical protein